MKAVALTITQTEKELLNLIGFIEILRTHEGDIFDVNFGFARWLSMQELMGVLESAIRRQESDQGDWLRAKEYRAAESGLKDKIRRAYMRVHRDGEE